MGRWDRRWFPRRYNNNRRYKDYDYEEPPPAPPEPHHPQSNPPPIQEGSRSTWEIDFCKSVHIPWHKVETAKKYMYCHENVQDWDDSAGEEAFQNAKRTYWEKINRLPAETPLPDPDMYIDKVDWSPAIDPGLMAEIEKVYFNPDDKESSRKFGTRREKVHHNQSPGCNPNNDSSNPWEKGSADNIDGLQGQTENWGQNDKSISVNNVSNPWEQSLSAPNQSPGYNRSNPWEEGSAHNIDGLKGQTENWGRNDRSISVKNVSNPWEQSFSAHNQSSGWNPNNESSNPWEVDGLKGQSEKWGQNDKSVSMKNVSNPWEQSFSPLVEAPKSAPWTRHVDQSSYWNQGPNHDRKHDWNRGGQDGGRFAETGWRQDGWTRGWKPGNTSGQYKQSSGDNVRCRQTDFVSKNRAPWNKKWEDKQLKNSFKGPKGIEKAYQSGCRKREGSFQNGERYKTSKLQVDDHGPAYPWQKERSHNSLRS